MQPQGLQMYGRGVWCMYVYVYVNVVSREVKWYFIDPAQPFCVVQTLLMSAMVYIGNTFKAPYIGIRLKISKVIH